MRKRLLIAFAFALVAACAGERKAAAPPSKPKPHAPPPPSVAAAKEIIANSPDFGEFEFTNAAVSLPMKKSAMNAPAQQLAKDLRAAGWIGYAGDEVVLPPKSKDDKRFLLRPNGFLDIVPLAKKELGEVTAVRPQPDGTVLADFAWKWIPNEVGQAFKSGPVKERFESPHRATAKLMWDGTSWTILRIDGSK